MALPMWSHRGAVWYRLVGVNLTESNIVADAEAAVLYVTEQLNLNITFGDFLQVVAPNASATPRASVAVKNAPRHDHGSVAVTSADKVFAAHVS
jgi:hypothetical protein